MGRQSGLSLLKGLGEFQSHLEGELTVTLLRGIGRGFEVNQMDEAVVADAIRELQRPHYGRGLGRFHESGVVPQVTASMR
jgi:hypothetical protein